MFLLLEDDVFWRQQYLGSPFHSIHFKKLMAKLKSIEMKKKEEFEKSIKYQGRGRKLCYAKLFLEVRDLHFSMVKSENKVVLTGYPVIGIIYS